MEQQSSGKDCVLPYTQENHEDLMEQQSSGKDCVLPYTQENHEDLMEQQSSGKDCVLPFQRFVINSPKGTITDSLVVMTIYARNRWRHEVLLTASAKISEREGIISPYGSYGQFCLVISHMCQPFLPTAQLLVTRVSLVYPVLLGMSFSLCSWCS